MRDLRFDTLIRWTSLATTLALLYGPAMAADQEKPLAKPSTETGEVLQGDALGTAKSLHPPTGPAAVTGYVYATGGYDTNANGATSADRVELPGFGGVILELGPDSVESSDSFAQLGGGLGLRKPLRNSFALVAGADVNRRFNQSQDDFETATVSGYAGANYAWSTTDNLTLALQVERFRFAHQLFRRANGAYAQYQRQLNAPTSLSVYAQFARLDYPTQIFRNADRLVAGFDLGRVFGGSLYPYAYGGAYGGIEEERDGGTAAFAHDLKGLRAGGQLYLNSKLLAFTSANVERRDYNGPDVFFLVSRDDLQKDFMLGVSYLPAKSWSIITQLNYTRNRSNVEFNDFARTQISLTVRRDFE